MKTLTPMEQWALLKRVDALEAAVSSLMDERKVFTGFLEVTGDRVEACELRSRLALALAEASPDAPELRRKWLDFSERMTKKYPGLKP